MPTIPRYVGWPIAGAVAYGLASYMASRAAYFPMAYPAGEWQTQSAVGAQDAAFTAEDGTRLHAWWAPAGKAPLATLFLHGNAGNVTHRGMAIQHIVAAGSSVLMLDYRGYGKSAGRPTESGVYADARAAYRYVAGLGYRPEQIVIHGESLGTAVAVNLAAESQCAGLILEAPFSAGKDMAATVLPFAGPLLFRAFDSVSKIGRVKAPVLVIHGDQDEIIPIALGRKLFAAAPEPKQFWEVKGSGHNDLAFARGYRERLAEFYRALSRSTSM